MKARQKVAALVSAPAGIATRRRSRKGAGIVLVLVLGLVAAQSVVSASMKQDLGGSPHRTQATVDPKVLTEMREQGRARAFVTFEDSAILARAVGGAPSGEGRTEAILRVTKPAYRQLKAGLRKVTGRDLVVLHNYDALATMFVEFRSERALAAAVRHPGVIGVTPERINEPSLTSSLPFIRQPSAVWRGQTGAGTSIAVIDSGVDYTRNDFGNCTAPNTPPGTCRVAFATDIAPQDDKLDISYHGTNVAGIAAGVAPAARIVSLDIDRTFKCTNENGSTYSCEKAMDSDMVAAVDWVVSHQSEFAIRALNLSFGNATHHTAPCTGVPLQSAFANARAVGVLPVVAAGNAAMVDDDNDEKTARTFQNGIAFPACTPGTVTVGAVYDANYGSRQFNECGDSTTVANKVICFSQTASILSVLAPGSFVTAGGQVNYSGTSMAAPHVAGAAAILAAAFPNEGLAAIEGRIKHTGPVITDPRNGVAKRRLDLEDALSHFFETPALGSADRQIINPFTGAGVSFTVHSSQFVDAVVGIVKNSASISCVAPSSDSNQKLGTGRQYTSLVIGEHLVGNLPFPIRASFSPAVTPPPGTSVKVQAEFQSLPGTTARIRLYNSSWIEVSAATAVVGAASGTCGKAGGARARVTVQVGASAPFSYAVLDTVENRAFVIDLFRVHTRRLGMF